MIQSASPLFLCCTLLSTDIEIFVTWVSAFIDDLGTHLATGIYRREDSTEVAVITAELLQTLHGLLGPLVNHTWPSLKPIIPPSEPLPFRLELQGLPCHSPNTAYTSPPLEFGTCCWLFLACSPAWWRSDQHVYFYRLQITWQDAKQRLRRH